MRIIKQAYRGAKGMMAVKQNMRQKNQIALHNAKASLAIEGMLLTPKEDELLSLRTEGKLKDSEFLAHALELAQNE